jgi:glutamate racemase
MAGEEIQRQAPIGVFDSGVGGLTVLAELARELPDERFLYFGDTGNVPYGTRPEAEILALTLAAGELLVERGVKQIVVACNTASVYGRTELRAAQPQLDVVVVVPAVKPAALATKTRQIAVATTDASARGGYLRDLIYRHAKGVVVHTVPCQRLVSLVEAGRLDGPEVEAEIRGYLAPALAAGVDQLVLGCTHFPAMRDAFERVVGPTVAVVDSGAAVARQSRRKLAERKLLRKHAPDPDHHRDEAIEFLCSGDTAAFEHAAQAILGRPVHAGHATSRFKQ